MKLSAAIILAFLAFSCTRSSSTDNPQLLENDSRYLIAAIREANSPSAAIEAYARADGDDPAILDAFVRRMVQFGAPEMAEAQALSLTVRQPNNGLAWAVTAYMNARRGQGPTALNQIQFASANAGDDPFVLYTAGQLSAWYDARGESSSIPQSTRDAVKKIHDGFATNPTFTQAYTSAADAYRAPTTQAAATQTASTQQASTQATTFPTTAAAPYPIILYPPPSLYSSYSYPATYTPSYTPTYAPIYRYDPWYAYDRDLYWLPGPYYRSWYWWPAPTYIYWWPGCNTNHHGHHHSDNAQGGRPVTANPKPDARPSPNVPVARPSPSPRGSGGSGGSGSGGGVGGMRSR